MRLAQERHRITVLGNGGWGCAMSTILANRGHAVTLWGHNQRHLEEVANHRTNSAYLPGVKIPAQVQVEPDKVKACNGAELILVAIPTRHLRTALAGLKLTPPVPRMVVSLTKGIDVESLLFPSEIIGEATGWLGGVAVLSGPTIAPEVARGLPASITLASVNHQSLGWAQALLSTGSFRVYTSTDKLGVELAGAVKNVIAIAAGACDGMDLGDNAKAALLARGITELRRLGRMMGAQDETFMGLAGMGDLYTTCASPLGRNRTFGERLGRGMSSADAIEASGGKVVEGADTVLAIHELAARHAVDMPICESVYRIVHDGLSTREALRFLLARELRPEEDASPADGNG